MPFSAVHTSGHAFVLLLPILILIFYNMESLMILILVILKFRDTRMINIVVVILFAVNLKTI